ncbi:MAG: 23S rRNA (adenine(2503)-C(2))-methyltransferase RlmN [Acidobacteriia bacterium]|nr:23S rRNA (adenine(2503)-C(2))-methyltransferase RlmN [Terriglobia bacterium]
MARSGAPSLPNLYGLELEALVALLGGHDAEPYHAGQIHRWLYRFRRFDPAKWTDLPRRLRSRLAETSRIDPGSIAGRAEARDGTVKYRIALADGGEVEAVHMSQRGRATLCLSSQVGCALDCDFCLTGKMGLARHLDAGEIAGQVALIQEDRGLGGAPFNVVFMGMGEPMHNYDHVMAAFRLLTDPLGFGLSHRRVTVSTSGLVPGIERLAAETARPRLAVSLNATTDAVRDRLMPVNRKYPLARLLEACRSFTRATGDRFSFEYVLLRGVNDTEEDVNRLARIVRGHRAKLNLIPFNPVPGWLEYLPPPKPRVETIRDRLLALGVPVSIRWSRGAEARAACGQLALLPDRPQGAAVGARAPAPSPRRQP